MDKSNAYQTKPIFRPIYKFAETMAEQRTGAFENQYKFNDYGNFSFKKTKNEHTAQSAELEEETGFYYYGARYYNPQISIWLSVDPLTEETMQPYSYVNNNPVYFTDPTGMIGEPFEEPPVNGIPQYIDVTETYFWDESQGNYWNSTKQETYTVTAASKPKGDATYIFNGEYGIQEGFTISTGDVDYDLHITLQESEDHWNNGIGRPLLVHASKIDLKSSKLNTGYVKDVGDERAVNFFDGYNNRKKTLWKPSSNNDLSRVYGTLAFKLLDKKGNVELLQRSGCHIDVYDFHNPLFKWWRTQSSGNPKDYKIYSFGTGKINTK